MKLELAAFKDLLGRLLSHKKNYFESFLTRHKED
jgi:hypothetical protein